MFDTECYNDFNTMQQKVIRRSKDSNIITKINTTITQHVTKVFTVKQMTNTERKTEHDGGQSVHEELRGMQQMNE